MKRDKGKIILVVVLGLLFVLIAVSATKVDPKGQKAIPKSAIEVLRPDELDDAKDKGIVLTKKVKAEKGEDLVGKSFSFNAEVFDRLNMKYPGFGEYFLRLNKDHTFVLVDNYTFKDFEIEIEDGEEPTHYLRFKTGNYVISEEKIKLNVEKNILFMHVLTDDELDNLDRVNDFDIDFNSLYVHRKTFEQLPAGIQSKINEEYIVSEPENIDKRLKDDGNYIIKKNRDYWRLASIRVDLVKYGASKDGCHLVYYDYLHKYDHVYPIPKSINEFISNKIAKGEVDP